MERTIPKIGWGLMLFLLLMGTGLQAQSIKRQTISSAGASTNTDGLVIRQTVGQPYQTQTSTADGMHVRPGFQQPNTFNVTAKAIESDFEFNINVFPNPATSELRLATDSGLDRADVRILDINGQVVYREQFDSFRGTRIACADWRQGVYFLVVANAGNQKHTSKLIITK